MKYLLTLASLVVFASSANAVCSHGDEAKQAALEESQVLASQDQTGADTTDPELLLLKWKNAKQVSYN